MEIPVIDVGGTHVKAMASAGDEPRSFDATLDLTPAKMVQRVRALAADWPYDVVSVAEG
jgi:polyphosphate glucokinase